MAAAVTQRLLTAREAAEIACAKLGRPVGARQIVSWVRRGIRGRRLAGTRPLGHYLIRAADLDGFLGYLLDPAGPGRASPLDPVLRALLERYGI